jgi:hypothetical protein
MFDNTEYIDVNVSDNDTDNTPTTGRQPTDNRTTTDNPLTFPCTQSDIANQSGITKQSVSKTLLKIEGILREEKISLQLKTESKKVTALGFHHFDLFRSLGTEQYRNHLRQSFGVEKTEKTEETHKTVRLSLLDTSSDAIVKSNVVSISERRQALLNRSIDTSLATTENLIDRHIEVNQDFFNSYLNNRITTAKALAAKGNELFAAILENEESNFFNRVAERTNETL